jgi:hypothetical protein
MATMQRLLPLAGFAIFFCATSALGQNSKILQGDIPFRFHVADQHFAPGTYEVQVHYPYRNCFAVKPFGGKGGAFGRFVYSGRGQEADSYASKLVFKKYGKDEYFLSEIWHPWVSESMLLPQSQHEVITSKLVAGLQPERVVVMAAVRHP